MPSSLVDEIDRPEPAIAVFSYPAGEEALVAAAKNGDELAFEVLVQRHERRIFTLALRFARIREDAEDIAQQTFQKAFINLPKFQGKSSFSTWLTRIAINEALMRLRKIRGLRELSIEDLAGNRETGLTPEIPTSDPNPETTYLQREREQLLSNAISKLTPNLRTAVELRELGDLSMREAAQLMGLSVNAVKGRLFHARRKLHGSLHRYAEAG